MFPVININHMGCVMIQLANPLPTSINIPSEEFMGFISRLL